MSAMFVIPRSSFWECISRKCVREHYSWNSSTAENGFYALSVLSGLCIRVRLSTSGIKGISVFLHEEYIRVFGQDYFIV